MQMNLLLLLMREASFICITDSRIYHLDPQICYANEPGFALIALSFGYQ